MSVKEPDVKRLFNQLSVKVSYIKHYKCHISGQIQDYIKTIEKHFVREDLENPHFLRLINIVWENSESSDQDILKLMNSYVDEVLAQANKAELLKNVVIGIQFLNTVAKDEFNKSSSKYEELLKKLALKRTCNMVQSNPETNPKMIAFDLVPIEEMTDSFGPWKLDRLFGLLKLYLFIPKKSSGHDYEYFPIIWRTAETTTFQIVTLNAETLSALKLESPSDSRDRDMSPAEKLHEWNKVKRFFYYEADLSSEFNSMSKIDKKALIDGFKEQRNNKEFDGGPILEKIEKILMQFTGSPNKMKKHNNGMILYGPPGTGKTELCKIMIKKSGLHSVVPPLASSEFNRSLVGESEKLIMDVFNRALKVPYLLCCLAIDEIDALVPKRTNQLREYKVDVLSLLLSLIGGIKNVPNMFLIASTNRMNIIDGAFLRRLEEKIYVGSLNGEQAFAMLKKIKEDEQIKSTISKPVLKALFDTPETVSLFKLITANFTGAALVAFRSLLLWNLDSDPNPSNISELLFRIAHQVANNFGIKFGGYSVPSIIQANNTGDYLSNLKFTFQRYIKDWQHNLTGRILIDLTERYLNMQFELADRNIKEIKLKDFKKDIKFTSDLVPVLLELAIYLTVPSYQLIDSNVLLNNSAFNDIDTAQLITEKLNEFEQYDDSMLIFDVDTLVGVGESSNDSSENPSYSIQSPLVWQKVILHTFKSDLGTRNGEHNKHRWCILISSSEFLIDLFKKSVNFHQCQAEKDYKEKKRKCLNCNLEFIEKFNKRDSCTYHPAKLLQTINQLSSSHIQESNTLEDLTKKAIEKKDEDIFRRSYYTCCKERAKESKGCKQGHHIEAPY